jgi:hypothetical protein
MESRRGSLPVIAFPAPVVEREVADGTIAVLEGYGWLIFGHRYRGVTVLYRGFDTCLPGASQGGTSAFELLGT